MDQPVNKENVTFGIAIVGFIASVIAGVCTGTWNARGYTAKIETLETEVSNLKKIIFLDKGGLNLLTLDAHTLICQTSQELFGKDIEIIKETLLRLESANKTNEELKLLLKSVLDRRGT